MGMESAAFYGNYHADSKPRPLLLKNCLLIINLEPDVLTSGRPKVECLRTFAGCVKKLLHGKFEN